MNDNRTTVIIERVFSKRGKTLEEIYIGQHRTMLPINSHKSS